MRFAKARTMYYNSTRGSYRIRPAEGGINIPYIVEIEQFQGPLDLLLHLVEKSKVDIRDIFISDITEQYIQYVSTMDTLDMESAGEFLHMAAWLLEIKSRSLLPKPPIDAEEEEEDPEQALIRRLERYRIFKHASLALRDKEQRGLDTLYRLPEEIIEERRLDLSKLTLPALLEAYLAVRLRQGTRLAPVPPQRVQREVYNVQECMLDIVRRMQAGKPMSFSQLLPPNPNRDAVVSMFLALLELLKLGAVRLQQDEIFGALQVLPGKGENDGST